MIGRLKSIRWGAVALVLPLILWMMPASSMALEKPIWNGPRSSAKVALTFDDGPFDPQTSELLRVLKRYNAKASFFVVGDSARKNPQLIRKIVSQGHELANHTFSHRRLDTLSKKDIRQEISWTEKVVNEIASVSMPYFRPPGGRYNREVLEVATDLGLKTVLWDVNAGDYRFQKLKDEKGNPLEAFVMQQRPSQKIFATVHSRTKNGSIVLFHNIGGETPKALDRFLRELQKKGISCVTLSELLGEST
jgi:peptidoglycan-N-acetylglucosamine deacetylase